MITKVSGTDPAYGATCVMLLLSAITILKESDKIPVTYVYSFYLNVYYSIYILFYNFYYTVLVVVFYLLVLHLIKHH